MANVTLGAGLAILFAAGAAAAPLPKFPPNSVWHRDITGAPVHLQSGPMLTQLQSLGGWGNANRFQIDFSFHVLNDPASSAPMVDVVPNPEEYYSPDCDNPADANVRFPLPAGGAIEGNPGYTCDNICAPDDICEDCHLIVVRGRLLYEAYSANVVGGNVVARCALKWDLDKVYPPEGRGEQCTSADAAGYPIAPLLFNADEVQAALPSGDLGHAIRFILPNPRMADDTYVHPAGHAGGPSGPATTVPYGARLRLKPLFNIANYNPAAQVILRTMKKYGIVLADGGNIALTAESDTFTTAKWSTLGITAQTFNPGTGNPAVTVGDFEVIETGPRIPLTFNCVRTPDDFIFIDYFQY
jgi:hypothetical protein